MPRLRHPVLPARALRARRFIGGAWLLGQSIRCAVDDEREKLGLLKPAPGPDGSRSARRGDGALPRGRHAAAPWRGARTGSRPSASAASTCSGCTRGPWLSRVDYPARRPRRRLNTKAPRSAPSSPARLSRVIEAVREHNPRCPISTTAQPSLRAHGRQGRSIPASRAPYLRRVRAHTRTITTPALQGREAPPARSSRPCPARSRGPLARHAPLVAACCWMSASAVRVGAAEHSNLLLITEDLEGRHGRHRQAAAVS